MHLFTYNSVYENPRVNTQVIEVDIRNFSAMKIVKCMARCLYSYKDSHKITRFKFNTKSKYNIVDN